MACLKCQDFDPNYHNGYCKKYEREVEACKTPSDGICLRSSHFDPYYRGGYCNWREEERCPFMCCDDRFKK